MNKVKEGKYSNFLELARVNTCNTVYPTAVAEGEQRGDIYTDDEENPQYALFWHISGFAYLTGQPKPDDMDAIYALMRNESGSNPRRFLLETKDESIMDYFRDKNDIEEHPRYAFRLKKVLPIEDIPEGYELREIDEELFSKIEGNIVPINFWDSEETFLKKGKGFCLTRNGEVATVAFSAALSSRQMDIGIETKEKYRRKGLAVIVAKKMVEYALSIGKEPVWDCDVANTGSRATAERVGFEIVSKHVFFKKRQ